MDRTEVWNERAACCLTAVAVFLCAQAAFAQTPKSGQREKISEGQYVRLRDNLRLAGSEQNWILWRLPDGYELEDHFNVGVDPAAQLLSQFPPSKLSPELREMLKLEATQTDLSVRCDSSRRPVMLVVHGKRLSDGKAVDVVKCEVRAKEVYCHGNGQNLKLGLRDADEFFYVFPFPMMLSAWITGTTTQSSPSKLAVLNIISTESGQKLDLAPAKRSIQSEGDQAVTIGDRQFQAHRARITLSYLSGNPLQLTVWYGSPGLVYAMEGGGPSGERMALVEYKKFSDF